MSSTAPSINPSTALAYCTRSHVDDAEAQVNAPAPIVMTVNSKKNARIAKDNFLESKNNYDCQRVAIEAYVNRRILEVLEKLESSRGYKIAKGDYLIASIDAAINELKEKL